MPTAQQDLEYVRSAAEVLEDYLLSKELYWPLSHPAAQFGSSNPTRLSLGGLLLADARARQRSGGEAARQELAGLHDRVDAVHDQWRSHWEQKAAQEFPARLHQWQNLLQEHLVERDETLKDYRREVRLRVMLELLRQAAGSALSLQEDNMLALLDARLRSRWEDGDFLWDAELEPAFPRPHFWFLYGRPAGTNPTR